jgi:hypothetical protein
LFPTAPPNSPKNLDEPTHQIGCTWRATGNDFEVNFVPDYEPPADLGTFDISAGSQRPDTGS